MKQMKVVVLIMMLIAPTSMWAQTEKVETEYEVGQIQDGYKVGVWEYKAKGITQLKIDYDQGKLLHLTPDTTQYLILVDTGWVLSQVFPHPRYIGSYQEFYKIFGMNLKYPALARRKKIEGPVYLEFEISTQGKAQNPKVLNDRKNIFTKTILETFELIPNVWLNAVHNKKAVVSKLIVPIEFRLGRPEDFKSDESELEKLPGKNLSPIIVTAYAGSR